MTVDEEFRDKVQKNKLKTSMCTVVELVYEPPGMAYDNIVCSEDNCPYYHNCAFYYFLNSMLKG